MANKQDRNWHDIEREKIEAARERMARLERIEAERKRQLKERLREERQRRYGIGG